jgi:3-dehydroquinate synthase
MQQSIETNITVSWRHQVHFTRRVFAPDNLLLREVLRPGQGTGPAKVLLVLDESLARARAELVADIERYFVAHSQGLRLVCPPLIMEGGERIKNGYFHISEIHSHIDRYHIDRHNYVVCVGGGALLDMVGLAAATAHRGVRQVRLPTTTLSQADSGVGVKNGINAFGKKNFIGTFAPPYAVINDFDFLETLTPRDLRAGFVEAVKVACIRDRTFFAEIEQLAGALCQGERHAVERVISRCAELHVQHITTGGDPFENGSARPLDFGHWAAHKLETVSEFRLRHGEAVAVGMALDVLYARRAGLLNGESAERILRLLERLGFELYVSELGYTDAQGRLVVLNGLEEFREHLGGRLTITLLTEIGRGVEVQAMDLVIIEAALKELRER